MLPENAKQIISNAEEKMQDSIDFLEEDLKTYRVGKANPSIFNNVVVDYYGSATPLNQVASITTPDAKTITIQPWERSLIGKIEKAILDANLGLTPSNNGEIIRCVVPALTEERRKDLIKKAKAAGENAKVVIRNARRDAVDQLRRPRRLPPSQKMPRRREKRKSRRLPTRRSRQSIPSSPQKRKRSLPFNLPFGEISEAWNGLSDSAPVSLFFRKNPYICSRYGKYTIF
jgi:ribosome recycling factor